MRSLTALIFLITLSSAGYSQLRMPAITQSAWPHLLDLSKRAQEVSAVDVQAYPIYRIHGHWFVSIFGSVNDNPDWEYFSSKGILRGTQIKHIASVKVPLERFREIDFSRVYSYLELPGKVCPDLDRVRYDVRADSVHLGTNLPQGYTGANVVIGITDWGFDYTHPMLYDTLLQSNRILGAWDQYKQVGNAPTDYSYGAEYLGSSELLAAQGDTSNIYNYHTHGTHVAGIAGGSGAGLQYRGMAPSAEFLLVTFLVDDASVLDAFSWMKEKADAEDKRLVVNMSWGLHYIGTLDGTSLLSQAIDALTDEGVVFVSSGGNNGDVNFHLKKSFANDSLTTRIQFGPYSTPNMWGQSISMWGEAGQSFRSELKILSGNNVELASTPLYHTADGPWYLDSILIVNSDTIFFNLTTESAHPLNGRPHMRLRVNNEVTTYKVILLSTAESGQVHYWNVVELTNGVGNWGMAFMNPGGTSGMAGNPQYGISEPACAAGVIAVAAHSAEYLTGGGNLAGGQLAGFSSFGPLITEEIKPDISAPGVNVASSISSFTTASYTTTTSVEFNGTTYDFGKFSGTSMSSPCVAGIVALMLEANPLLTPTQVKDIIQASARLDEYTGTIVSPGDVRWGMGKVNAHAAVELALATVGLSVWQIAAEEYSVYPNPANDQITLHLPNHHSVIEIVAFDISGKKNTLVLAGSQVDVTSLSSGLYILRIQSEESTSVLPLVISR